MFSFRKSIALAARCCAAVSILSLAAHAQAPAQPWQNQSLSASQRADLVLKELTLDEKIDLLHGNGMKDWEGTPAEYKLLTNGGAGVVKGNARLGLPAIQLSDAAYGVRASAENGRYSTAMPSNLASAASWDREAACAYGALIGRELRAQGYNMTLGGGVNLTRDPRNGRTFEYMGEDPVLAGTLVGQRIRCEGEQHVISDIKHFAFNDQESGRNQVDVHIAERAMHESDLLAFEIGIRDGHPNAVMCSYNGVNGDYACENKYLLTDVLKRDWKFPGFVISDWGGTHSTEKASAAGLDQQQPLGEYYGAKLKEAVVAGRVPMAELDDHVRRVLYAEFASGIVDHPMRRSVVDVQSGFDISRRAAEQGSVLLKNSGILPLDAARLHTLAVIGPHADTGMISGGGSAQVDPPGQLAGRAWRAQAWFPTSPLLALQARVPAIKVAFASGEDIAAAVAAAKTADVAVIFAYQWEAEDADLPNLSLPGNQDALIAAVTAANPHTVVVLESGTAVTMPWLPAASAVLEAWFAGSRGADAVANILFGDVNPSGKLPMTFPRTEADLPHPTLLAPAPNAPKRALSFTVTYDEGAKVGYKWYEAEHKPVLFPFGFGLSYTTFRLSALKPSADLSAVDVTVTNTGHRRGAEVAQIYATLPASAGEGKRLIGFQKVELAPGETRTLHIAVEPLALNIWDGKWTRPAGTFTVLAGDSSADLPLHATITLP